MQNYPEDKDSKIFDEELDQLISRLQKKDPHAAVVFLVSKNGVSSSANCKGNLLTQISMIKATLNSLMKELMKDSPLGGADAAMAELIMKMFREKFGGKNRDDDNDDDNREH